MSYSTKTEYEKIKNHFLKEGSYENVLSLLLDVSIAMTRLLQDSMMRYVQTNSYKLIKETEKSDERT